MNSSELALQHTSVGELKYSESASVDEYTITISIPRTQQPRRLYLQWTDVYGLHHGMTLMQNMQSGASHGT